MRNWKQRWHSDEQNCIASDPRFPGALSLTPPVVIDQDPLVYSRRFNILDAPQLIYYRADSVTFPDTNSEKGAHGNVPIMQYVQRFPRKVAANY